MLSSFGVNCKKGTLFSWENISKDQHEAHLREERYLAHRIVEASNFELTNLKIQSIYKGFGLGGRDEGIFDFYDVATKKCVKNK